jgi:hypothetical protein
MEKQQSTIVLHAYHLSTAMGINQLAVSTYLDTSVTLIWLLMQIFILSSIAIIIHAIFSMSHLFVKKKDEAMPLYSYPCNIAWLVGCWLICSLR